MAIDHVHISNDGMQNCVFTSVLLIAIAVAVLFSYEAILGHLYRYSQVSLTD